MNMEYVYAAMLLHKAGKEITEIHIQPAFPIIPAFIVQANTFATGKPHILSCDPVDIQVKPLFHHK